MAVTTPRVLGGSGDRDPDATNRLRIWIATSGLILLYLTVGLALRYPVHEAKILVSGDEHHYLTQALSLLLDGDLVVVNNYERGDYLTFYPNELDPSQWNLIGDKGYSGHSPGAGIVAVTGMWIGGWVGVLATLAVAMGATFAITAAALSRLRGGSLPPSGLVLLAAGFACLPLFAYSHTLYPETFMLPLVAAVALLTVMHFQASTSARRTAYAVTAICLCALAIALHPKFFVVLVAVTIFFTAFELYDAPKGRRGATISAALSYLLLAALWLTLFSWLHQVMWGDFHPGGWWLRVRSSVGVSPTRAVIQFVDLFFGRDNGIFFMTPLAILAVAFLVTNLRAGSSQLERRVAILAVILVGSVVGLGAYSQDWHGGDSPLGRYVTPLVPILLLIGVCAALRSTRATGERLFLVIVVGLGVLQNLTYNALPMSFRPQPDGSGVLSVITERIPGLASFGSWFWSASQPSAWVGLIIWIVVLGVTIWLFARPERLQVPRAPDIEPAPLEIMASREPTTVEPQSS